MSSDTIIWTTIGGSKKFCSYKKKFETNTFCRNMYNISGLCSRQSCPLANSRYATVLEQKGKLYLYMKTAERAHTPRDLWERIPLSPNFLRSLAQINAQLQFWPRFIRKKAKQRLTRIHQMLIRMRKMHGKERRELVAVHKKTERQDKKREERAHRAAQLQDTIKHELLQRLRQGTYGDLYDDIVNYNNKQFNEVLDEEEDEEFDWLDEEEEQYNKNRPKFVEAYSDSDHSELEEEDEDEEFNYEYEYENEGKNHQREKIRQSVMDDQSIRGDDDDDDDDDDDQDYLDQLGSDYEFDDEDNEEYEDDSEDMEDQVPDFATISKKNDIFKQAQNQQKTPKFTPTTTTKAPPNKPTPPPTKPTTKTAVQKLPGNRIAMTEKFTSAAKSTQRSASTQGKQRAAGKKGGIDDM